MFLNRRHLARQLLGLLRARLGRVVVLGSGRERLVMPCARRHRAAALARRLGEARRVQGLDGAARGARLLALAARHLPGALGRADLGALVRRRPDARALHPALPRRRRRRLARALRAARPSPQEHRLLRAVLARVGPPAEQRAARRRLRGGAARHALPAVPRRARHGQDLGGTGLLRRGVRAADAADRRDDRHRRPAELEVRPARGAPARARPHRRALRGARGRARAALQSVPPERRRLARAVAVGRGGHRLRHLAPRAQQAPPTLGRAAGAGGVLGHEPRPPRHRRVHARRRADLDLHRRADRAHGGRRHPRGGRLHLHVREPRAGARAELHAAVALFDGDEGDGRRARRRASPRTAVPSARSGPRSATTTCAATR